MSWTRREFLTTSMATGLGLGAATWSMPGWLRTAQAAPLGDRCLVVIQLSGGNDGLNTVIPFEDDHYHRARPVIGIEKNQVLELGDNLGLHPQLTALRELFQDGRLSIVNNVGYPNPNRSHFRSMDIWHSANPAEPNPSTGWLGRTDDRLHGRDQGSSSLTWRIGGRDVPLALRGVERQAPSIEDPKDLRWDWAELPKGADLTSCLGPARSDNPLLENIRAATLAAHSRSGKVEELLRKKPAAGYPKTALAQQLHFAAHLFSESVGPRVIYLTQEGYDTHARQSSNHGELVGTLSRALGAFQQQLRSLGLEDRVLTFVFSEFGRRVRENGSQGTDHGAAAPCFLLSSQVKGGFHGGPPRLDDLDNGDVPYTVDFRSVYATLLESWLGIPTPGIIPDGYAPLPLLRS